MPVSCLTPYWTLAVLHASQLPDIVLNTGSLVCQSAAWHRTEHWLSYMSVSCLTPYWTLAVLHASQLPDTVLNTGSLVCQSAAWHRTEHQLSFMLVAWLCESTSASLHVSQLSDPLNEPLSPSMSVSCLTLWMNPGSVACQSVVWSSALTLDPLHVRQLPDPVTTLALLHVRQVSDPVNEPFFSLAYQSLYQSHNTRRDADKHDATYEQRKRKTNLNKEWQYKKMLQSTS